MLPRTGVPSDGLALELRGEEGGGGEQRVRTTTKINKMSRRCFSLFDVSCIYILSEFSQKRRKLMVPFGLCV